MLKILDSIRLWWVVVAALLIRFCAWPVTSRISFPDTETYFIAGQELFTSGRISSDLVMPLHPVVVGLMGSLDAARVLDIFLSALTVLLVYRLTIAIFDNQRAAILAALATAVYPFFVFYSGVLLTETLYIFLLVLAFDCFYRKKYFLAALVVVLSILQRPTLDFLAPLLIIAFTCLVHHSGYKKAFSVLLAYAAIYLALFIPWWMHQHDKYDQFVRLNLADGLVWYSGNNPLNTSGGGVVGSAKGDDLDKQVFEHIEDPYEKNEAYKAAAFEYIKENPARFVRMMGVKFVRFWRLYPYTPEFENPFYVIVSILSFGPVLLLALLFVISRINIRRHWHTHVRVLPIYMLIGYLSLVHMMTIGSIRYRLPLEPFMIVLASMYVIEWFERRVKAPMIDKTR